MSRSYRDKAGFASSNSAAARCRAAILSEPEEREGHLHVAARRLAGISPRRELAVALG
jgi:hypothetical protein